MSTDRQLLEAAAKAAGIEVWPGREHLKDRLFRETSPHSSGLISGVEWNPLEDSGDALELAVKLNFIVDTHGMHCRVSLPYQRAIVPEPKLSDPLAATRRAIVRAAAAIGKVSASTRRQRAPCGTSWR